LQADLVQLAPQVPVTARDVCALELTLIQTLSFNLFVPAAREFAVAVLARVETHLPAAAAAAAAAAAGAAAATSPAAAQAGSAAGVADGSGADGTTRAAAAASAASAAAAAFSVGPSGGGAYPVLNAATGLRADGKLHGSSDYWALERQALAAVALQRNGVVTKKRPILDPKPAPFFFYTATARSPKRAVRALTRLL